MSFDMSAKGKISAIDRLRHLTSVNTSSLDTDLTRNTRAPHFTPQQWLLCHMGLYWFEFEILCE